MTKHLMRCTFPSRFILYLCNSEIGVIVHFRIPCFVRTRESSMVMSPTAVRSKVMIKLTLPAKKGHPGNHFSPGSSSMEARPGYLIQWLGINGINTCARPSAAESSNTGHDSHQQTALDIPYFIHGLFIFTRGFAVWSAFSVDNSCIL